MWISSSQVDEQAICEENVVVQVIAEDWYGFHSMLVDPDNMRTVCDHFCPSEDSVFIWIHVDSYLDSWCI